MRRGTRWFLRLVLRSSMCLNVVACAVFLLSSTGTTLAGTWRDNFGDGDLAGWQMNRFDWRAGVSTPDVGNWRAEDGVAIAGDDSRDWTYGLLTGEPSWTDYTIEVSVRLSQALRDCAQWASIGLSVRVQTPAHRSYSLMIQNWGADPPQLIVREDDEAGPPYEVAGGLRLVGQKWFHVFPKLFYPTEAEQWYRLKVAVEGDIVRCFIDEEKIVEFTGQGAYPSGRVGFSVHGVVANFDDFMVTGPDVPESSFPVSAHTRLAIAWGDIKD